MNYLNTQYLLDKRPSGMPEDDCWKLHQEPITSLEKNEILIEVKYLSIDPYMRGRMNKEHHMLPQLKLENLWQAKQLVLLSRVTQIYLR